MKDRSLGKGPWASTAAPHLSSCRAAPPKSGTAVTRWVFTRQRTRRSDGRADGPAIASELRHVTADVSPGIDPCRPIGVWLTSHPAPACENRWQHNDLAVSRPNCLTDRFNSCVRGRIWSAIVVAKPLTSRSWPREPRVRECKSSRLAGLPEPRRQLDRGNHNRTCDLPCRISGTRRCIRDRYAGRNPGTHG
jgi:hypothetical protein